MVCPNKEKQEGFNCVTQMQKVVNIDRRCLIRFCETRLYKYTYFTFTVLQNGLVCHFKLFYINICWTQEKKQSLYF